jgi:hypothetical protein
VSNASVRPNTLTGDDIALAMEAAALAIRDLKKLPGARRKFIKGRIAEYEALIEKLRAISDQAYPYTPPRSEDEPVPEHGAEEIMKLDARVVRKTRAAALRANQ